MERVITCFEPTVENNQVQVPEKYFVRWRILAEENTNYRCIFFKALFLSQFLLYIYETKWQLIYCLIAVIDSTGPS